MICPYCGQDNILGWRDTAGNQGPCIKCRRLLHVISALSLPDRGLNSSFWPRVVAGNPYLRVPFTESDVDAWEAREVRQ